MSDLEKDKVVAEAKPQTEFEVKRDFKTTKKEYKKGETIKQTNADAIAYLKSINVI